MCFLNWDIFRMCTWHFHPIRQKNSAFLWPMMHNTMYFLIVGNCTVLHIKIGSGSSCRNIANNIRYGKTGMVWLPDGEKILWDTFTCFNRIHEHDRQTDIQTSVFGAFSAEVSAKVRRNQCLWFSIITELACVINACIIIKKNNWHKV